MSRNSRRTSLARCALVWLTVTGAALLALDLLAGQLPDVASLDPTGVDLDGLAATPFDVLLARMCAVALVACAAWLWLVTSLLLLEAVTGLALWRAGCPPGLRRVLLTACGMALVAGATPWAPAGADTSAGLPPSPPGTTPSALAGLPLPDRATARTPAPAPAPVRAAPAPREATRVVVAGDTLWDLARERLPAGATDGEITRAWHRIWADNRDAVGPDPDLIHPGTVLHLTNPKEPR